MVPEMMLIMGSTIELWNIAYLMTACERKLHAGSTW